MYSTGTVTATANSTKLVGTGTKWLNNINRVSAEQAIQVQIGTTVHNNSIQSIQSDTELTLNFPLPTATTGAKYVILTTMVHSVSDAMNKIVSMNGANVQFSDILTRWMTEQGIITVTLPDQTIQQLRTTKEMDKLLDGKLDKAGGGLRGNNGVIYLNATVVDAPLYMSFFDNASNRLGYVGRPDNKMDIALVNSIAGSALRLTVGNKLTFNNIEVMRVGDSGFGSISIPIAKGEQLKAGLPSQMFRQGGGNTDDTNTFNAWGSGVSVPYDVTRQYGLFFAGNGKFIKHYSSISGNVASSIMYSTANTTKDSNGNLKVASPIIKVFADRIELNDESEGVELEKLCTGRYKLKGTLGMNSDASWGGYHGGLVIPNGINNLPLVWADFKVEADGDIIIETHYRKHADLPPPVVLNRLITYPEFMDENGNELDSYTPCDIPNGHWVDVRVNMPSNSIYNQKQAEAERLAKIEAERLAQEEAKRIAEEAERADQKVE
ncbi:hypothetical protein [Providencia rettgeri]|uniref:phage tail fiber protein n=1 Tax=Providencia rettgeri TaxID=587 RepID=UPI0023AAC1BF|nr:hypothetical protein [Providencia rettgeri]